MFTKDVEFRKLSDGSGEVVIRVIPANKISYEIILDTCSADDFDVASKWFFAGWDMHI